MNLCLFYVWKETSAIYLNDIGDINNFIFSVLLVTPLLISSRNHEQNLQIRDDK